MTELSIHGCLRLLKGQRTVVINDNVIVAIIIRQATNQETSDTGNDRTKLGLHSWLWVPPEEAEDSGHK
jgi:hypothetical protein